MGMPQPVNPDIFQFEFLAGEMKSLVQMRKPYWFQVAWTRKQKFLDFGVTMIFP
jgi:hypothetical protein